MDVSPAENPFSQPAGRLGVSRAKSALRALDVFWWEVAGYAALIVAGLAMRLWDLGSRAMHHDESLHALYSWKLFNGDGYQHNPMMHGPFQFEANAALFFVFGDSDVTARLLYAVAGVALIAMPLLLRSRLGRLGALLAALMLAASPAMLYFSRFARNDILMAVWAFGLVVCMWRYFDEGRSRYLYISAALLALAFATKESAYLVTGTLGLWAMLLAIQPRVARVMKSLELQGVSPPVALGRVARGLWLSYQQVFADAVGGRRGEDSEADPRPASFLVFLVTLTLPQWSAFVAVFQDTPLLSWTNLTLVAPEGSPRIGDPVGGGIVIAFLTVAALLILSIYFGYRWRWSVWWRSALVFYSVWTLLYTTFFTNFFGGVKSGIWQALGYWVVQQGEGRGDQPWYYYFIISSVYEFLPIFAGVAGIVYFLRKRDRFSAFLVFWPLTTFALYTIASEKMPWLLVNITLPFIVLSAKFLAQVLKRTEWRALFHTGGYWLVPAVPLLLVLLAALALYPPGETFAQNALIPLGIAALAIVLGALVFFVSRIVGFRASFGVSVVVIAAMMLALSVRAGAIAAYRNGDTPVEMLVYTQTSPDVTRLLDTMASEGADAAMPMAIDGTSGFSWPWAWYFRNEERAYFPTYSSGSFETNPSSPTLVVHSMNREFADEGLADAYREAQRIRHRWWFPEHVYRGLTPGDFLSGLFDRAAWRGAASYWLNREGVRHMLGSEDSFLYFRDDVRLDYEGVP